MKNTSQSDQSSGAHLAMARQAWPDITVPAEDFWRYVSERTADTEVERLHIADLYLACSLARGDRAALSAFERVIMPEVGAVLRRRGFADTAIDEQKQELRAKLLTGSPPQITEYQGRGPLRSWVLIIAVRGATKLARRHSRELASSGDELVELAVSAEDPALAQVKKSYRDVFRAAFADAVQALSPRQRTLLRLSAINGLNIDQLGAIYHVHRATVARWLDRARSELRDHTRACLAKRLGTDRFDADSVLDLIASRLDASVERLFASASIELHRGDSE